tara:strand:- start:317 stop:538 length:222 start_codon:yes stop_codon:yes gene_type:complete
MTQLETLNRLGSFDNNLEVASNSRGTVEMWNLILCWTQDAEQEGNDLVRHIECALCDESANVQEYFISQGFEF